MLKGKPFVINRPEKYGGDISYDTYADLEKAYADKSLWPGDLKTGVAAAGHSSVIANNFMNC